MSDLVPYPGRLPSVGVFTVGNSKRVSSRHYVRPGYHRIDSYDYGWLDEVNVYSNGLDKCTTVMMPDGRVSETTGIMELARAEHAESLADESEQEAPSGEWRPLGPATFESQKCVVFEWAGSTFRRLQYVTQEGHFLVAMEDHSEGSEPVLRTRWRIESTEEPAMEVYDISRIVSNLEAIQRP